MKLYQKDVINIYHIKSCKLARKAANTYVKSNNLTDQINNEQYKTLCKKYKSIIQRKRREYLKQNRDKLNEFNHTNQTDCWKLWNKLTNKKNRPSDQPDIQMFHDYFKNQAEPPPVTIVIKNM